MRTRKPSITTLRAAFGENAPAAKALLHATYDQLRATDAGRARFDECYNVPPLHDLRLHVLNALGGFHGVETARTSNGHGHALYLNAGETYAPTLILWQGHYRVQSLGDFVETLERRGARFE